MDRLPRKPLPPTRDEVAGRKVVKLEQLWLWARRLSESLGVLCIVLFKIFVNDVGVFLLLCAIIIAYTFDDPWRALLTLLPLMTRGRCAIIIVGFSTSFWLLLAGAIANSDAPQET